MCDPTQMCGARKFPCCHWGSSLQKTAADGTPISLIRQDPERRWPIPDPGDGSTPSKLCADPRVGGERHSGNEGTGIREVQERNLVGVEESPGCVKVLIEQVLHEAERLDVLRKLIGRMQVDDPIGGHLRIL